MLHVWHICCVLELRASRAVIFLDADTLVVSNMDDAFACPGFCATLRHSERFNSGVMVITPSNALFRDMISRISTLGSYTGCAHAPPSEHGAGRCNTQ